MNELITNISTQTKYHSFLIVQTDNKQIAEKWSYYVLSCEGQLLMHSEQLKNQKKHEYNIGVDTISYQLGSLANIKLILAQGNWLKPCLTNTQLVQLNNAKILKYDTLQVSKQIHLYYYIGNKSLNYYNAQKQDDKYSAISTALQNHQQLIAAIYNNYGCGDQFIEIRPKYIHNKDCLIFQIENSKDIRDKIEEKNELLLNKLKILPTQHFKQITKKMKEEEEKKKRKSKESILYTFKSEYAIISDQHFLNCLVRGKKSIGSYYKDGQYYRLWIDQEILQTLYILYVQPKL